MPHSIADILSDERQHLSPESADTATFYSISNCQVGLRGIALGNFLIKQVVEDLNKQHRNLKDFVTLSPIPSFAKWAEFEYPDIQANSDEGLENIENQRKELTSMVAWYLRNAKRENGLPFDPVASFHLGNGARLERVNWAADRSPKAINQSLGMMVNYRYLRDEIEKNHHQFTQGMPIAASNEVIRLERAYTAKNSSRKPLVNPSSQV